MAKGEVSTLFSLDTLWMPPLDLMRIFGAARLSGSSRVSREFSCIRNVYTLGRSALPSKYGDSAETEEDEEMGVGKPSVNSECMLFLSLAPRDKYCAGGLPRSGFAGSLTGNSYDCW